MKPKFIFHFTAQDVADLTLCPVEQVEKLHREGQLNKLSALCRFIQMGVSPTEESLANTRAFNKRTNESLAKQYPNGLQRERAPI